MILNYKYREFYHYIAYFQRFYVALCPAIVLKNIYWAAFLWVWGTIWLAPLKRMKFNFCQTCRKPTCSSSINQGVLNNQVFTKDIRDLSQAFINSLLCRDKEQQHPSFHCITQIDTHQLSQEDVYMMQLILIK